MDNEIYTLIMKAAGPVDILKAKYYKKVPTGNPKHPYRYYYSEAAYKATEGRQKKKMGKVAGKAKKVSKDPRAKKFLKQSIQEKRKAAGKKEFKRIGNRRMVREYLANVVRDAKGKHFAARHK